MTNNELIGLLAKSLRDPSQQNYSPTTLAAALTLAKYKLVSLVGKQSISELNVITSIAVSSTISIGRYGTAPLPSDYEEQLYCEIADGAARPTPIDFVFPDEFRKYQYQYSGGDSGSPKFTVVGSALLLLGVTSGSVALWYQKTIDTVSVNDTDVDLPSRYIPNLVELSQSIILSWEEKYEAAEVKVRRQIQELKGEKVEREGDEK